MNLLWEMKELLRTWMLSLFFDFKDWMEWRKARRERGCTCHMGVYELSCKEHTETVQAWQGIGHFYK